MMEMSYILIVVVRVTQVSALAVQEGGKERVWAGMDTFSLLHYVLDTEFKSRVLIVLELRFSNLPFLFPKKWTMSAKRAHTHTHTHTTLALG